MSDAGKIRVLLVDDSAVVRGALGAIIDKEPDLCVATTATNGAMALTALRHTAVDVVLLDVEMPEMDGLTALPLILQEFPSVRVIMASSLTHKSASVTMQALAAGAVDYITKPSARGGTALGAMASEIVAKVRGIGRAAVKRSTQTRAESAPRQRNVAVLAADTSDAPPRLLAIAASTGGPNAIADVLTALPQDFPLPIVVTQHMPPVFTALLAQRLGRDARRECVEAADRMSLKGGMVYVAPGDYHLTIVTHEGAPLIRLSQGPPENHCRPAADVMLRSAANVYGASVLAVVLTGMGEDGRRGCEAVRARGGRVIVQDEATSVVWGMPGAVATAGLANWVLPLTEVASRIQSICTVGAA